MKSICQLIILIVLVFILGCSVSAFYIYSTLSPNYSIGCWSKVTDTERHIAIQVNELSIEEILDTTRHEVCHEIYWRLNPDYNNYNSTLSEEFAESCVPQDYLKEVENEKANN